MAGALTTKQIKDGGGNLLDFRVWDESGAGTGPFSFISIPHAGDTPMLQNLNGRAADDDSAPVVLSNEDLTALQNIVTGLSVFRSLDLDETEEEVKGSAGKLYKLRITNFATTARYIKIYNATAAGTTVGTTTPIDTISVPPAAAAGNPTVITEAYGGRGLTFDTALSLAATTALADADTGAPSANDVVVSAYYI